MNKLYFHQAFKFLIVLSSALGVILAIVHADDSLYPLTYFTNQSNLLVFLIYLFYIFYYKKYQEKWITIIYQVVLAIVLTAIVYHLMLRPYIDPKTFGVNPFTDLLVHTVTPILVVVERIIFGKKGILQRKQALLWLTFPFLYYLFVLLYGFLGGSFHAGTDYESKYPYFFLNIKEEGIGYFFFVISLILMIGYLMVFINRVLLNRKRNDHGIIKAK
ncbi:MAG: Pr6Pr family membrane protein [Candidatus Izemoplasmatales bacterium]